MTKQTTTSNISKKYITLDNLQFYHTRLMKDIKALMELTVKGQTNCPNCGAPITSEQCDYCGTNFMVFVDSDDINSPVPVRPLKEQY